MRFLRSTGLVILIIVLSWACGSAEDTSAGGITVPRVVDPDLTIGLVEGDSAYLFGNVMSVVADGEGRVYVGDRIGATVRAYDSAGRFVRMIAREGGGPGEIDGWPADLAAAPEGGFYVRDGARITVFSSGQDRGVADSLAAVWTLPGYGNLTTSRGRVGRLGEYYYPGGSFRPGERPRYFYVQVRDGVMADDTLEVPDYPRLSELRPTLYRLGPSDALMIRGLSHVPFAALPVWDVTPSGTILSSDAFSYTLIETDMHGDTMLVIRGPSSTPREIPATERADSARALRGRLDSLRVPVDELIGLGDGVREGRLPAALPPLIGIHVAADATIWVEQWPHEGQGQHRFYDVFEADGQFKERVVLRAPLRRDPAPFFGSKFIVAVIADALTGVDLVVRFARTGPEDGPASR